MLKKIQVSGSHLGATPGKPLSSALHLTANHGHVSVKSEHVAE